MECDAWVAYYRRNWRRVLVRSYALLLGAVHRLPTPDAEVQVSGVEERSAAAG